MKTAAFSRSAMLFAAGFAVCGSAFAQSGMTGQLHMDDGITLSDCVIAYQYTGAQGILIGLDKAGDMGDGSVFNIDQALSDTDEYSVLGIQTDAAGGQHAVFTFGDGSVDKVKGQSFDNVFGQTNTTEGVLIGLLKTYNTNGSSGDSLTSFYGAMCDGSVSPPPVFSHGNIFSFSDGQQIGEVQSVPEPSELVIAAPLILGLLVRRRRK